MSGTARFPREREIHLKDACVSDYIRDMDVRREMFGMAVIIAAALSAIAAAVVVALDSLGLAPQPVLVLSVIIVGFVASWVSTGRVERSAGLDPRRHGVAAVPVRN